MSIELKPGRWRTRGGLEAIVEDNNNHNCWPWRGRLATGGRMTWASDGRYALAEGPGDLVEFLGEAEDDLGSIKHNAAKALVTSAESLKSMLDPEEDGRYAILVAEFIVLNARVLEALTRPEIAGDDDDGGES